MLEKCLDLKKIYISQRLKRWNNYSHTSMSRKKLQIETIQAEKLLTNREPSFHLNSHINMGKVRGTGNSIYPSNSKP